MCGLRNGQENSSENPLSICETDKDHEAKPSWAWKNIPLILGED